MCWEVGFVMPCCGKWMHVKNEDCDHKNRPECPAFNRARPLYKAPTPAHTKQCSKCVSKIAPKPDNASGSTTAFKQLQGMPTQVQANVDVVQPGPASIQAGTPSNEVSYPMKSGEFLGDASPPRSLGETMSPFASPPPETRRVKGTRNDDKGNQVPAPTQNVGPQTVKKMRKDHPQPTGVVSTAEFNGSERDRERNERVYGWAKKTG